jgi:hypothetical protein
MLSLLSVATWLITANPPLEEGRALYRAADQAPWASERRELDTRARRKALQSHFLIGGALVGGAGAVVLLTVF